MHRAKKNALNFQSEATRIKAKFLKTAFLSKVFESTINDFNNDVEELHYCRLMKLKQLRLTQHSQTKMNFFQKFFRKLKVLHEWSNLI